MTWLAWTTTNTSDTSRTASSERPGLAGPGRRPRPGSARLGPGRSDALATSTATTVLLLAGALLASIVTACSSTKKTPPVEIVEAQRGAASTADESRTPATRATGTTGTSAPASPADAVLDSLQPTDTVIRFDFSIPITYGYVKGDKRVEYLEFVITADGTGIARETDQMRYRQLQVSRRDLVTALNTVINSGYATLPPRVGPVVTTRRPTQVLGTGEISVVVAPGMTHTVTFEGLFSELATNGTGTMPENAKKAITAIGDLIYQVKNKGKAWIPAKIRLLSDGVESIDGLTITGLPRWPTTVPVPQPFSEAFFAYEPDQVRSADVEGAAAATLLPLFSDNGTAVLQLPNGLVGAFFWQPVL